MKQNTEIEKLLSESAYNPANEPEREDIVFRIQFQNIGSLGNFALITGRPKAGKTKYIAAINAAAMTRQEVFSLSLKLPENKRGVAHWDTEQNLYDYHAMMKLQKKLVNIENFPLHYHSFHCRRYSAPQIIAMVRYFLSIHNDIGLVVLDGLLDLIMKFNDEGQSKMIVNFLKEITDVYNVLVIGVLHRSVSNDKSIGHLGSAADRAAQSVLIVEVNKISDITKQYVLRDEYLRSASGIDPIAIWYNPGLDAWEQTDYICDPAAAPKGGIRKRRPPEYDNSEHTDNIRRIFNSESLQTYRKLVANIGEIYSVGTVYAKDFVPHLLKEGLIFKTATGYTNVSQARLYIQK